MMTSSEEWRHTPEAPGYEASSYGRVRFRAHVLRHVKNQDGYRLVSVKLDGRWTSRQVAACVCAAFHGPRPEGHWATFKSQDRSDTRPENLEWKLPAVRKSLANQKCGEARHTTKLTAAQVALIRRLYVPYHRKFGGRALATRFGVRAQTVDAIIKARTWRPKSRAQELREAAQ